MKHGQHGEAVRRRRRRHRRALRPEALIVYGSFADGTCGPDSDFDAIAVGRDLPEGHDTDVLGGVRLDLFTWPASAFEGDFDVVDIEQIHGGRPAIDRTGLAARLLEAVDAHVKRWTPKPPSEVAEELAWCDKMLARARRGDAEGLYRMHWLLTDSLEICFDALGWRYPGPKKALCRLEQERPALFAACQSALAGVEDGALEEWIGGIKGVGNRE